MEVKASVIDVSKYNGSINWNKVETGAVIIRLGYRGYGSGECVLDDAFSANIKGASKAGIPIGLYFFTQAITISEAKEEANFILNNIGKYEISYPIYIDSEYSNTKHNGRADKIGKSLRTNIVKAFCETIQNAGYKAGVYASTSWFGSMLNISELSDFEIWVAQYASACKLSAEYGMWQHSSKGSVSGISGNVDLNHCYKDYTGNYNTGLSDEQIASNIKICQKWFGEYLGESVAVTGKWDDVTKEAAIKSLQKAINEDDPTAELVIDGNFGAKTKAACPSINLNNKNSCTKVVQAILYCLGLNPQEFSGKFNQDCIKSVKKFQSDNNINVDGIFGKQSFATALN